MEIRHFYSGSMQVNCYLAYDETKKAFVIDPGGYHVGLTDFIRKNGLDLNYIILTHGHGDHIGGVEQLQEDFPDAKLVASVLEKELLADSRVNLSLETVGKKIELTADLSVADGDRLLVGATELMFLSTPGHTPGGMCIVADGCCFSGDTLFEQSIGRTDFPGGDFQTLVCSIREKLFALPDQTKVYPGHMGFTSIGFEKEHNPFV